MSKLTLSPEIEQQVKEILAPLKNPEAWKKMKLPFAPSPSAVVMMRGKPGAGKTALANYMARQMKAPPLVISFAGVAGPTLGETEHKIQSLFNLANEAQTTTIHLEECDSILWSRDLIDAGNIHQLGFVNTLLTEIDKFIARDVPSLLILSTNYPKLIDSAMERRISDIIDIPNPNGAHAVKMWKAKLPMSLRGLSADEYDKLSALDYTPDDMEKHIKHVCRRAMVENREPSFADFGI